MADSERPTPPPTATASAATAPAAARAGRRTGTRWSLGKVLGLLVVATAIGLAAGLSFPIDGQMGWTRLADGDLRLRWPWPAGEGAPVDPQIREAVWNRGPYRRPDPVRLFAVLPRTRWYNAFPLPGRYDRPEPSALSRLLTPSLGAAPGSLSRNQVYALLNTRLAPADIAEVAKQAFVPIIMFHDVTDGPKQVSFDVTVDRFEQELEFITAQGAHPISLKQWWNYITRGGSLPEKPVLLTFDDGYESIYSLIYPRLKQRGWPAAYFVVPSTIGKSLWGKGHVTWAQLKEMQASGLCEIQPHSMTHPELPTVNEKQLRAEILGSRDAVEQALGKSCQFFCYPNGKYDERVIEMVRAAGFVCAFTYGAGASGRSRSIWEVLRYGEVQFDTAIRLADAGPFREVTRTEPAPQVAAPPPPPGQMRDYGPITFKQERIQVGSQGIPMAWASGGRPVSVHCDYRYGVKDVSAVLGAGAAINGGFFQLARVVDISNAMLGPVMSQYTTRRDENEWRNRQLAVPEATLAYNRFVPGEPQDVVRLTGRPLVLIGASGIRFVEFDTRRNSLEAVQTLMPDVTDVFVGGAWLVRDGRALTKDEISRAATGDHDDFRRRAWFGIDKDGRPVLGATPSSQRSAVVAQAAAEIGVVQATLLDSGFSTSLAFNGNIYVTGHSDTQPSRPIPHMILLQGPIDPASVAANPPNEGLQGRAVDEDAAGPRRRRRR